MLATPAYADEFKLFARYDSDWIYHGVSETLGEPAVGLGLDWQSRSRLFAGMATYRMLDDSNAPRPWSTLIYAGVGAAVGERGFLSGSIQRRNFPTSNIPWNYTEFEVEYDLRIGPRSRLRLRADYSPNYYSLDASAVTAEAEFHHQLNDRIFIRTRVGALEASDSSPLPDYHYGSLGMGLRLKPFVFDVSAHITSEADARIVGLETFSQPRWVARVVWQIY
ncbi:MAG: hypothetical protein AAGI88_24150 [Pseudomonadota bacterium]